jgi:hypothetical protein
MVVVSSAAPAYAGMKSNRAKRSEKIRAGMRALRVTIRKEWMQKSNCKMHQNREKSIHPQIAQMYADF